jgi:hypothetical protein
MQTGEEWSTCHERGHGDWFKILMDGLLSDWKRRDDLNGSSLAHETWRRGGS